MKKFLFFIGLTCFAQTKTLQVLQPGDMQCTGNIQHDDSWTSVNGTGDVQVSSKMVCRILITSYDTYVVIVKTFEPLTTIGVGQRVFTINVNGESKTIDIVRLAGNRQMLDVGFVAAAEKYITITFEAQIRTALWSQIAVMRMYNNILPVNQNVIPVVPVNPPALTQPKQ